MITIDENDIGKTELELLTDLIYESTGQRAPQCAIEYGKPVELDARPDILTDPNTYIPFIACSCWDTRLSSKPTGFLYRRRYLTDHFSGIDLHLEFTTWPTTLHQVIIDQINPQLHYPLRIHDFIDYEITDENTNSLRIEAAKHSLFWTGSVTISIPPPDSSNFILVENRSLDGFRQWAP